MKRQNNISTSVGATVRRKREERGGPTVWRRRGEGWCHREEEEGEGWSHRVEEEGGGERGGATVRRKRERGGCSAFVRSPLASLGAAWGREEEVQHL